MDERKFAEELFEVVRVATADPEGGVTRPSYSHSESGALLHVQGWATADAGLSASNDAARNLWLSPKDAPTGPLIYTGSHVDSVKCGGNYDGLAGVVASILAVQRLGPKAPVVVLALRGEEGAWNDECYKGSKALFGKSRYHKTTVPILDPRMVKAFVELHIEQGPVLEKLGAPVGIVTAIRGNVRYRLRCVGEAGHSGTTPWDDRKDPVFAIAALLTAIEDMASAMAGDCVVTCGVLHTDPASAMTRIAAYVDFTIECRSDDPDVLSFFTKVLKSNLRSGAEYFDVKYETASESRSEPVTLQHGRIRAPKDTPKLVSGAGHDAAVFAEMGVPTGMIFVRNTGGSHNPNEAMTLDDFMIGVDVLEATLRGLL